MLSKHFRICSRRKLLFSKNFAAFLVFKELLRKVMKKICNHFVMEDLLLTCKDLACNGHYKVQRLNYTVKISFSA